MKLRNVRTSVSTSQFVRNVTLASCDEIPQILSQDVMSRPIRRGELYLIVAFWHVFVETFLSTEGV